MPDLLRAQQTVMHPAMSRRKNHEEGHTVGLALLFLRRDAGMTLRQLSAATGSTPSSLSRYEKGHQMPRLDTLRRVVARR